jgi:penicillin-insensitive murein endopeptidase
MAWLLALGHLVGLTGSGAASRSIGFYSDGALANGVPVAEEGRDHYLVFPGRCYREPEHAPSYPDPERAENFFGHALTVEVVLEVARQLRERFPGAPRVPVGELSNRVGGRIPFHLSHQNGLDVDVYFLPREPTERARCEHPPHYEAPEGRGGAWRVSAEFDRQLHWELAAAFAARPEVRVIFSGTLIREELARWARAQGIHAGERRRTLAKLRPVFCRAPEGVSTPFYRENFCPHDDHFHVRFGCPRDSPRCRGKRG